MNIALPALPLWKWLLAALAAFLVGISKTGIAGMGIVSVTLFPFAWPAKEAVGIALIVLICADCVAITAYPPKNARWEIWRAIFPWAALGVFFGAQLIQHIRDEAMIKQLIGAILLIIVALQLYVRVRRKASDGGEISASEVPPPPLWITALAGLSAGIATLIANAAGPVIILYLLPRRLPKREFIGTNAWLFFALNLFKVPFSWSAGMMHASSPLIAACLLPAAVCGGLFGKWLLPRIEQSTFELSALILTALAALRLLFS